MGELGRGGQEDVVDVLAVGDEAAEPLDRAQVVALLQGDRPRAATAEGELADRDAHEEQQDRRLHVVAGLDAERAGRAACGRS